MYTVLTYPTITGNPKQFTTLNEAILFYWWVNTAYAVDYAEIWYHGESLLPAKWCCKYTGGYI